MVSIYTAVNVIGSAAVAVATATSKFKADGLDVTVRQYGKKYEMVGNTGKNGETHKYIIHMNGTIEVEVMGDDGQWHKAEDSQANLRREVREVIDRLRKNPDYKNNKHLKDIRHRARPRGNRHHKKPPSKRPGPPHAG
jgi:hypothetical protein